MDWPCCTTTLPRDMNNTTIPTNTSHYTGNGKTDVQDDLNYVIYYVIMMMIMLLGIPGNVLMVLLFRHRDFKMNALTPLLMNIAVGDLFITFCGYTTSIYTVVNKGNLERGSGQCYWSALINCTVGIATIGTHVCVSVVLLRKIKSLVRGKMISSRSMACIIAGTWFYALVLSTPPFFGWSSIRPHSSGFSCGPDWSSKDALSLSYSLYLVTAGFLIPVSVMVCCYLKIYRYLRRSSLGHACPRLRTHRLDSMWRITRILLLSVFAFLISWTPYSVISVLSIITQDYVFSTRVNLLVEMAAKASVIYNPFVYVFANKEIRTYILRKKALLKLCCCSHQEEDLSIPPSIPDRSPGRVESFVLFTRQWQQRKQSRAPLEWDGHE